MKIKASPIDRLVSLITTFAARTIAGMALVTSLQLTSLQVQAASAAETWFSHNETLLCEASALNSGGQTIRSLEATWQGDGFVQESLTRYSASIEQLQLPGPSLMMEFSGSEERDRQSRSYHRIAFQIHMSQQGRLVFEATSGSGSGGSERPARWGAVGSGARNPQETHRFSTSFTPSRWEQVNRRVALMIPIKAGWKSPFAAVNIHCWVR